MKMGCSAPLPGFHLASHGARALSSIQLTHTEEQYTAVLVLDWHPNKILVQPVEAACGEAGST